MTWVAVARSAPKRADEKCIFFLGFAVVTYIGLMYIEVFVELPQREKETKEKEREKEEENSGLTLDIQFIFLLP